MNKKLLGVTLALAAAAMVTSGKIALAGEKGSGKIKCTGANGCKGKGVCGGKENACAGKNGCKGKGWEYTDSEKDCTAKGGTVLTDEKKKGY